MLFKVYSIFDTEVKAYMQPFFLRSKGEAIRALTSLLSDPSSNVSKYPHQYILFEIGDYDDDTGKIVSHVPESLGVAQEFVAEQTPVVPVSSPPVEEAVATN